MPALLSIPARALVSIALCVVVIVLLALWTFHLDKAEADAIRRRADAQRQLDDIRAKARRRAADDQAARLRSLGARES